jgi:hypothetical protein
MYDVSTFVRVQAQEDHEFMVIATLHTPSPTSGNNFLRVGRYWLIGLFAST